MRILFIIFLLASQAYPQNTPSSVLILKDSGISIRKTIEPKSEPLGGVHYLYTYPVTDGKKSYVKVKTSNDMIGWAWVGENDERFQYLGDHVTSLVNYDIPVKNLDSEDLIKPNESVELIQIWYSRLKVKTPDNKHGWIYAGRYNDPWVTFADSKLSAGDIYAYFTEKDIQSNGIIDAAYIDYDFRNKAYSLSSSEESELNLAFDLDKKNDYAALQIQHKAGRKDQISSSISIVINDIIFLENFNPVYNDFRVDLFHIGHLLKSGRNKLTIMVEDVSAPYYIKSLNINY